MDSKCVRERFARLTVALSVVVFGFTPLVLGAEYSLIVDEFNARASVGAGAPLLPSGFPPAWRSRPVRLNPLIATPDVLAEGDVLILSLFADTVYRARIDRVFVNINGTVTVRGRIEGYSLAYLLISTTADCSLGSIRIPEKGKYYVIQSEPHDRIHYLIDVDVDQLEKPPAAPTTPIPPPPTPQEAAERGMLAATLAGGPLDPATIDVMVVYTPAALNLLGGLSDINNFIGQTIENANLALDNSNTKLTMNLVHSAKVDYVEDSNSYIILDRLTYYAGFDPWNSDPCSYMDEVHNWRDEYSADLVVLLTDVNDYGGLGWLLSSDYWPDGAPYYGFSLTSVRWTTWAINNFVTIHEMGHNMGCHHSRDQEVERGPGLFDYSAGWYFNGQSGKPYCTVMAYQDKDNDEIEDYERVGFFSTPLISHDGRPVGDEVEADNARTIRETKFVVAGYREVIDIGLRVYDGTEIIRIACEPKGSLTSPLRIRKNGVTYGIVLVDTPNPHASKIRVQTSSKVKALRKL